MDHETVDQLARLVGSGQSRRRILKTLAGGALAAAAGVVGFTATEAASRKRAVGFYCSRNADCQSGVCALGSHIGRKVCECGSANDCPASTDPCQTATCTAGSCGVAPVGDNLPGSCPSGQVCCGGTCADTRSDASHCGSCAKICRATDSCESGVCSGAGTCPANSDYCATGNVVACDGSQSCHCYGTTSGARFCGSGPAVCVDCNVDADCVGLGVGSACVDLGTHCSSCGSSTPTHVCLGPCGAA